MTTTRTITITKEIEEKMRLLFEEYASPDCPGCDHYCWPDEGRYLEATELLNALGIEPSEDFTKWWTSVLSIEQEPPVHTCRISTEMEVKGVLDSLKATLNDCESD